MEGKPTNIFEQILFGQKAINDNIVALADNLSVVNDKLNELFKISEPSPSGTEKGK